MALTHQQEELCRSLIAFKDLGADKQSGKLVARMKAMKHLAGSFHHKKPRRLSLRRFLLELDETFNLRVLCACYDLFFHVYASLFSQNYEIPTD